MADHFEAELEAMFAEAPPAADASAFAARVRGRIERGQRLRWAMTAALVLASCAWGGAQLGTWGGWTAVADWLAGTIAAPADRASGFALLLLAPLGALLLVRWSLDEG